VSRLNLPAHERIPPTSFWDEFGPLVINVAIVAVVALLLAATR
jgi:hypothetical protein